MSSIDDTPKRKYIFGPVPSRRLGYSLGVDTVPFKTCTFDCIYCQLGPTEEKTSVRKDFVPVGPVVDELAEVLDSGVKADYITISGSGEPSLFSGIGRLISEIKKITDVPVAVITNSSLLYLKEVREALMKADLVVPSLDAASEEAYKKINRPVSGISSRDIFEGLLMFSGEFKGTLWLECFFVDGINTSPEEVSAIAEMVSRISPDKVQLNTIARPPADSSAKAVSEKKMREIASLMPGNVEIIADFSHVHDEAVFNSGKEGILTLVRRRPCSLEDICSGLSMHRNEALKYIEDLLKEGSLNRKETGGKVFYG